MLQMNKILKSLTLALAIGGAAALSPVVANAAQKSDAKKLAADGSVGNLCPAGRPAYKPRINEAFDRLTIEELQARADAGKADAMVALGLRYVPGEQGEDRAGLPPVDAVKGVALFKAAAEKGDGEAAFLMGVAHLSGVGAIKDDTEAMTWFIRSATQGNVPAQFWVGQMTAKGRGVTADWKAALPYFQKAAEGGWILAFSELGYAYETGLGIEQDYQKAAFCYRQQPHAAVAQYNLRKLIDDGHVPWQSGDPGAAPDMSKQIRTPAQP